MKKLIFVFIFFFITEFVLCQLPPTQLIINHGLPINCDSAVLFDWNDCNGATSYAFQIFAGASTIINVSGLLQSEYTALPNTFTPNTYYYCRMNATYPAGTSMWSQLFSFNTASPPPNPPALISPPDSSMFVPLYLTFDWSDSPGATMYRIQISTNRTFTTNIILDVSGLVNSGYVITTNILSICTRYFWRVNASNSIGTSNWSDIRTFTTMCPSGINQISFEIPAEYKLYNNYPNPFNPKTKIKYQITNSSITSLVVYDVLGKEMAILVNEYQSPGIYEVPFDARKLSSGIYFYRLQSGDFVDTKKMLMIK